MRSPSRQAELARSMLRRALRAQRSCAMGDRRRGLRLRLQVPAPDRGLQGSTTSWPSSAQRLFLGASTAGADAFVDDLPKRSWRRLNCGTASKGQHLYDWASVEFAFQSDEDVAKGSLVRRSIVDPSERAYYLCRFPRATLLRTGPRGGAAAGRSSRRSSRPAGGRPRRLVQHPGTAGADVTLALLAHAFLEAIRAAETAEVPPQSGGAPRRSR